MFMTTWVVQMILSDSPSEEGQAVLVPGDNKSAVTWSYKCGGGKFSHEAYGTYIECGWWHVPKHVPGREN